MKFTPYKPCVGRKYRLLPKLYRPFTILISGNFCNQYFIEKNKVRFIGQFLRWFYKSRWGYKVKFNISSNGISNGDSIILCGRTQKAAFKNLLLKLNYWLMDYDILKRRQYVLHFEFLFLDVGNKLDSNIFLDILSFHEDKFKVFIILNGYYINDFNNILYYYNTYVYNQFYNIDNLNNISEANFNLFSSSIDLLNIELAYISFNVVEKKKKD